MVADAGLPAVQALVRWDPVTFAGRELEERRELRFPPACRMAALSGPHDAVRALLDSADLPPGAEVLGPVPVPESGGTAAGTGGGTAGGAAAAAGDPDARSGPFPGPRPPLRGRRAGGRAARRTGRADGEKGAGSGPAGA